MLLSHQWNKTRSTNNINAQSHLKQAHPIYSDWEVTTIFYSALHLVDAYVIKVIPPRPADHTERNRLVRNNPILKKIRAEYDRLYILCRSARYDRNVTEQEVTDALTDYNTIKAYLLPLI